MVEIPGNDTPRDFEGEVNRAVEAVVKNMGSLHWKNCGWSDVLKMNHAQARADWGEVWVRNDVAAEVARRFKAKGYFVRYHRSIKGTPFALCINKRPSKSNDNI